MKISFAPLEGVTGYTFRNVHHALYRGVIEYYTPFLAVRQTRKWKTREKKDIDPALNAGIHIVPQLLTNHAEDFIWAAKNLASMGYQEINLNLGCPSPTVVTKHKGAGFLEDPDSLDEFLNAVCTGLDGTGIAVSVKTRIGLRSPSEMEELLTVFNRYPLQKLIVHPRVREDYYTGPLHMDTFRMVYEKSVNPVVYNGDIVTAQDYQNLINAFPDLSEVMIGRGLIRHPDLAEKILDLSEEDENACVSSDMEVSRSQSGSPATSAQTVSSQKVSPCAINSQKISPRAVNSQKVSPRAVNSQKVSPRTLNSQKADTYTESSQTVNSQTQASRRFQHFHDTLLAAYQKDMQEPNNVLPKMKELWSFWGADYPEHEKELKKIRKSRSLDEYKSLANAILSQEVITSGR